MGSTPVTVNQSAQTVDQIINGILFNAAVPITQADLTAAFPFLAVWPLSSFLTMFLNWISQFFYVGLSNFATIQIIALQTSAEKSAYAQAEANLRLAHASGDPIALQNATQTFKTAFQSLVHFDGSASV